MGQYLGVALLDLPAVCQAVMLMVFFRRAVLIGAKAGVVVFEEGDGAVLMLFSPTSRVSK
jgi:hypothetical protein